MSELDEETIIEDYKKNMPYSKLFKKYGIDAFQLGMILGRHGVKKRPRRAGAKYPDNVYGLSKAFTTTIPKNLQSEFKPGQRLQWSKLGKGEWKVTVIS